MNPPPLRRHPVSRRAVARVSFGLLWGILWITQTWTGWSITLEELTVRAMDHSPVLQDSAIAREQAGVSVDQARARYWPTIELSSSASYLANPPEGVTISQGQLGTSPAPNSTFPVPVPNQDIVLVPDPESTYFQLKLNLTQPIFTWGKINLGKAAAEHGYAAAASSQLRSQQELKRDITKAYYGLISAVKSREILLEAQELLTQIVQDREQSFAQGSMNRESLLEARQNLAAITTQAAIARAGIQQSRLSLAYLSGSDQLTLDDILVGDPTLPVPDPEVLPGVEDLPDLVARAKTHNPLFASLGHQIQQAEAGITIQKRTNSWFPDLGLSVALELTGQRFPGIPNWYNTWDVNLTVSVGTSIRMLDGGAQAAKVKQAGLQRDQAAAALSQLNQSLELQVMTALEALIRSREQYTLSSAQLEFALEQEKNARVSFENQLITREQYQGAQIQVINRRLEQLGHSFSIQNALADLEFLLGVDIE